MDLRLILSFPWVYSLFSETIGAKSARYNYINNYVKPKEGYKILDIGCGPADILKSLPQNIDYLGFDIDKNSIKLAQKRFNDRGKFFCERVTRETVKEIATFDLALATGILHHLTDNEAIDLFELAKKTLKPGSKLITLDGCYTENQSFIRRYVISKDRGKYIRTPKEYTDLAQTVFSNVKMYIKDDMLRIPYTHIILECQKDM